jgi:hypothetical protein
MQKDPHTSSLDAPLPASLGRPGRPCPAVGRPDEIDDLIVGKIIRSPQFRGPLD